MDKTSVSLKELKESQVNLKILKYLEGDVNNQEELLEENLALIKILRAIIRNKSNLEIGTFNFMKQ